MAEAMSGRKVIIDTDLILEHVIGSNDKGRSTLRRLMPEVFCYTTVFNVIEAFELCRSDDERGAIEESVQSMKILGLNAKSGKMFGELFGRHADVRDMHLLIAGVCKESKLPLVTGRERAFKRIRGLEVIGVSRLQAIAQSSRK